MACGPSPFHRQVRTRRASLFLAVLFFLCGRPLAGQVPTPETFFGFPMGADRQLASADAIEQYFERVASSSDRVAIVDIGPTTDGHRTLAAIVSAPENIRNLESIRAANQRLADPRTLPPDEARAVAAGHKVVVAIGCSIHASEVGGAQAANEVLYWLAASNDPLVLNILREVVVILIPSLNPDGYRLITDWYEKQKGTPYEGGPMPWLYHKYAGHDLNRDGFMMNMAESRNLSRFFYTRWHPQVLLAVHQMGTHGPRFFAPPSDDPIDLNYDPLIWREAGLLGGAMTLELQRDGRRGVVSNAMYDYYWPGYEDSMPLGHNTVCLLVEAASAKVATPLTIAAGELRGGLKGLPEYRAQVNFPDPWPGGTWRLRDVVEYDMSAIRGLLRVAAAYREMLVQNFYDLGARAVAAGSRGEPFAFLIPPEQHDPVATRKLEEMLIDGGVEIQRTLEPFRADGDPYPAGVDLVFLAQPYRAYVKTLLERQAYPAQRLSAQGQRERPYDATGWTLPAQMGVAVRTIERTFEPPAMSRVTKATIAPAAVWGERKPDYYVIDARGNGGALAANRLLAAGLHVAWLNEAADIRGYRYGPGSLVVSNGREVPALVEGIARDLGLRSDGMKGKAPTNVRALGRPRIGLYRPWTANVDEGWTRWLLEQYQFSFENISDADVKAGDLQSRFDAIILPSASADRLRSGHPSGVVPPEYAGGLGSGGVAALDAFVRAGGTLICLDQAGALAVDTFALPVRDVTRDSGERFFCPGSLVRIDLDPSQPLSYGMPKETAGYFTFSSAYEILPKPDQDAVQSVATYARQNILISGWLEGEAVIAGRTAALQATVGSGRVVLLGFPTQHRGQSYATFRLLFNALLTSK